MAVLKIDSDFSEDPAGRYYSDGKGSGEEFREEFFKTICAILAGLGLKDCPSVRVKSISFSPPLLRVKRKVFSNVRNSSSLKSFLSSASKD